MDIVFDKAAAIFLRLCLACDSVLNGSQLQCQKYLFLSLIRKPKKYREKKNHVLFIVFLVFKNRPYRDLRSKNLYIVFIISCFGTKTWLQWSRHDIWYPLYFNFHTFACFLLAILFLPTNRWKVSLPYCRDLFSCLRFVQWSKTKVWKDLSNRCFFFFRFSIQISPHDESNLNSLWSRRKSAQVLYLFDRTTIFKVNVKSIQTSVKFSAFAQPFRG